MTREHDSPRAEAISLVLPAFNEEECIETAIAEAAEALAGLAHDYEILVVDDGSRDQTAAAVERAIAGNAHVRLVSHGVNRGYGAALRSGFDAARHDLVAFTDADCQFHLEDLGLLLALIADQDVVCGFRMDRKDAWLRRFYSGGYNLLVRALLGLPVKDLDCALKLFRARVLSDIQIETNGFLVNAEVLTKLSLAGCRISQVGVRHRARFGGVSTVSPLHAIPVLAALLRFWWSWVLFPAPSPEGGTTAQPNEPISPADA
jgi:dolichol-phosphate mannosyltransferase